MDDRPESPDPQQGNLASSGAGCAVAIIGLAAWAFSSYLLTYLFHFMPGGFASASVENAALFFIFTLLFCTFFWSLVKSGFSIEHIGLKPIPKSGTDWFLGLLFGLGGAAAAVAILALGGGIRFEIAGSKFAGNAPAIGPMSWVPALAMFILLAGEEEILGRGFLFPMIKRSIGFSWALILSSIAFSLMHLLNPDFSPMSATDILLAGIFLALLRELTGDIYLAWGAHFGWNIGLIAAGLPVSGYAVHLIPHSLHATPGGPSWITGGGFGPEGGMSGIIANLIMVGVASWMLSRK